MLQLWSMENDPAYPQREDQSINPSYDFSAKVALVVVASTGIELVLGSLMRPI